MANVADDIANASAPTRSGKSLASFWHIEMTATVRMHKDWHRRGDKIVDRYLDERDESTDRDLVKSNRRMNVLWSNIETMKPTLLAKRPIPNVSRANKDKDPVGRLASTVLERCLSAQLRCDTTLDALKEARSDLLLPGRGVVFESYDAEIEEADERSGQAGTVTEQKTVTSYVHWKNFYTNRARNWGEVWYVAKEAFLTRKELHEKYDETLGSDKVNMIPLDHRPEERKNGKVDEEQFSKATVYQIWDKNNRKVVEIAKEYQDNVLAEMDPPIKFENFFPCPRPLFATLGGKSIIPTPDYVEYQDQAEEIDLMTNRIHGLTKALKLRGIYDASNAGLAQLFNDASENELVPVESFSLFAEKGGIAGAMVWVPIKEVAAALIECMRARDDAKRAMYEVTGISDIVRGATVASETATAQQLKSQWGSIRIRDRQQDVERFARDVLRLKATIISSQFTQETLAAMSNVKLLTQAQKQAVLAWQQMAQSRPPQQPGMPPMPMPPPPVPPDLMAVVGDPTWEEVIALLRNERLRSFIIDVETDSTIEPDQQSQRQDRTAFVTAVTQYLMAAEKILMPAPQMAPLMGELLTFAVRGWKVGEQMESKIEEAVAMMSNAAQAPPAPDPRLAQAQQKAQIDQAKIASSERIAGAQIQAENQRTMVTSEVDKGWQQLEALKLSNATRDSGANREHKSFGDALQRSHNAQQASMQRSHDRAVASMPMNTGSPGK